MPTTITVSPAGEVRITVDGQLGTGQAVPPILPHTTLPSDPSRLGSIFRDDLRRWFGCTDPGAFLTEQPGGSERLNQLGIHANDVLVISPEARANGAGNTLSVVRNADGTKTICLVQHAQGECVTKGTPQSIVGATWEGVVIGVLRPMPLPAKPTSPKVNDNLIAQTAGR